MKVNSITSRSNTEQLRLPDVTVPHAELYASGTMDSTRGTVKSTYPTFVADSSVSKTK